MKKTAWFGWACLALACYISYVHWQRGDPKYAVLTAIAVCLCLLFKLWRSGQEELRWDATATRWPYAPDNDLPLTVKSRSSDGDITGPAPVKRLPTARAPQESAGWLPLPPARLEIVAKTLAALEQAANTTETHPVRIDMSEDRYVDVELKRGIGGGVTISITGHNFTGGQFNARLANRLKKINGTQWQGPFSAGKSKVPPLELTGITSSFVLPSVLSILARVW